MINDPFHPEEAIAREKESNRRKLLGVVCAVGLSAILLVGYAYMRNRHARQVIASSAVPPVADNGLPKGPPVAQVSMDEPLLQKGTTTFGGTIKNISNRQLTGLSVSLDLIRRKDGQVEQRTVAVEPSDLQPSAEATYSVKLSATEYGSIRFMGVKADPDSSLIAYSSSPGKKRPPERIEPRTIIVKKGKPGEFINSPDNPARVP
ncbi:MAG TPA: hypothetical protein VLA93_20600 [Pyrinomonadaceae bacterium]|nr:hypothetical protein [Pyrinomonadaceae bacterium]